MMADYIDRQTAIVTAVKAAIDWHKLANPQYSIAYCIGEAMRELPSADIDLSGFSDKLWAAAYERGKAEVVRCKDCKYFDSGTDEDGKLFFKCLGWVYGGTSEDDFCSHGERKDD